MLLRFGEAEDDRPWRRAMATSDSRTLEIPWTPMSCGPIWHVCHDRHALLSRLGSRFPLHVQAGTPVPFLLRRWRSVSDPTGRRDDHAPF